MVDSTTITATANDIYGLVGYNTSYSTAHSVYYATNDSTDLWVGQRYLSSKHTVWRGTPLWKLSSLEGYVVTSAIIKLTGYANYSTDDFNVTPVAFTESTLSSNSTCFNAYGSTTFGSWNSSNYNTSADGITITLNSSGISYINDKVGGNCIIMLRSDEDIASSAASTAEYVLFYSAEYATSANRPHLYLEYEEASSSTWTPKIMMIMKPLADGFLEWIRKPLQKDLYLQI